MIRKLMFPTFAFLVLVAAVGSSPEPASAFACNNMYCNYPEKEDCFPLHYWDCNDQAIECMETWCPG